eukprot:SAG31_NODE_42499_length_271_cov_0.883721_1_plen_27_part_10
MLDRRAPPVQPECATVLRPGSAAQQDH